MSESVQSRRPPSKWRHWYLPFLLITAYLLFLSALTIPEVQRNLGYLHRVKWPLNADFSKPHWYGAPPGTRNLRISTEDGESLGAWHIPPSLHHADFAHWRSRPTILYLHGNAASRAQPSRVKHYNEWSTQLNSGFADSTGSPQEDLVVLDALAAWKYIMDHLSPGINEQEKANDVVLVGHSMGTFVASQLAATLAKRDVYPRAIVLIAPFTSLPELLLTYSLGPIPLLSPLKRLPGVQKFLLTFLTETWNTTGALTETRSPILLLHAKNDLDIPSLHSSKLYQALREPSSGSELRIPDTMTSTIPNFGAVRRFTRPAAVGQVAPEVIWAEMEQGGHNRVGLQDGVTELIGQIAGWVVFPVSKEVDEAVQNDEL